MDLSIVIVSWNTRELLLECLEELERELDTCARQAGLRAEVIVVDNDSSDGSGDAVKACHADVVLIRRDHNGGFAVGANLGIASASGRVIALLNSDTRVVPGALARCLEVLDESPGVGVVGAQLLHPNGHLQNSVHAFPSLLGELLPRGLLEALAPHRFPSKRHPQPVPTSVDAVKGAALFVRREVIEAVGPLCEDYFFFLEETDWCWRIREAGWEVRLVPDARVVHVSGASSKRREPMRTRIEYHRSLYRFLHEHRGAAVARAAVAIRMLRGAIGLLGLALLAPLSRRARARLPERAGLLAWHLVGQPGGWGLEGPAPASARALRGDGNAGDAASD
jgi:GT2 family glycosyltransferase